MGWLAVAAPCHLGEDVHGENGDGFDEARRVLRNFPRRRYTLARIFCCLKWEVVEKEKKATPLGSLMTKDWISPPPI